MAWKHSRTNPSVATGMRVFFSGNMVMFVLFLVLMQASAPTTTHAFQLLGENRERDGSGVENAYAEPDYGYVIGSPNGPNKWGDLRPEWATCKSGNQQSPINLVKREAVRAPIPGRVVTSYRAAVAKLRNAGHDVMLEWGEYPGSMLINGVNYRLQQVHWHSPSEHTINGRRFALELHMVHQSTHNRTAVLGVLYEYGLQDGFLAQLESGIRNIANVEGAERDVGAQNPNHVGLHHLNNYYRYIGSLTTPPCTEGVLWTVFDKVMTVATAQVKLLKDAVNGESNVRPTQPTNRRRVLYHYPSTDHL